ncbi:MAG: hypothetical protein H0V27_06900 [Pyrinomonadaceae bacterium]|nr:hypothetical protein [Pyrinomonadaceae bacterium]
MTKPKCLFAISLIVLLLALYPSLKSVNANAARKGNVLNRNQGDAQERGRNTGYSDGYQAGWRDSADGVARSHSDKEDYRQADRLYAATHGSLEDYRTGYRQGFAQGYEAGYERRPFSPNAPGSSGQNNDPQESEAGSSIAANTNNNDASTNTASEATSANPSSAALLIPANAEMRVELLNNLGTNLNVRGDKFQARVLDPVDYKDAVIEGRVVNVKRPGRVRGTAELQLSFDEIRLTDNRTANLSAQVIEILETRGETGAAGTDTEGGVRGKGSAVGDAIKVGAGAAVGAVIGAITGGGKGAGVGAAIGGAVGAGGVLTTRGKNISLPRGTQLRIRTAGETRVD